MTRDVEVELSLFEMVLAAKKHWVMILLVAVLCAVIGGVFGYIRKSQSTDTEVSTEELTEEHEVKKVYNEFVKELYEENIKMREESDEIYSDAAEKYRNEWNRLSELRNKHPLCKLDPADSTSFRLTMLFRKTGTHLSMIYDWIQEADDKSLFGDTAGEFSEYKNDLIRFGSENVAQDEAVINVYSVEGFDAKKAVAYLKEYIATKSHAMGLTIVGITSSKYSGYDSYVYDFQKDIMNRMTDIQGSLDSLYKRATTVIEEPVIEEPATEEPATEEAAVVPATQTGISIKDLMKYAIIGFIGGLFIGIVIAIFIVIKKGCVLSMRQVEDTFGLERLGNCAKGEDVSLDVLNANLDVLVGDDKNIMLLGSSAEDNIEEYVNKWNAQSDRKFVPGKDLINDSATIDALSDVEGILLGVIIGKSKHSDIQGVLIRANKLGKNVLGYVVI